MNSHPAVRAQAITHSWRPSEVVYQVLAQHNIPREWIEDQVPEFVIYWSERGAVEHSWGSKFMKHCMHEWRHHEIKQARAVRDIPMTANWVPSQKARAALRASGITDQFINEECLDDFILYWTERGDVGHTWNSKFVQHVRYRWANRSNIQKSQSLYDELTDRSWADGYTEANNGKG